MKSSAKIRVAVVGLQFGARFAAAFANHPSVASVGLCDLDSRVLARVSGRWNIPRGHRDLEEILACREYDAVALFTPIPDHARQVIAVLRSGKHCACAVPMATTIRDLRAIIAARKRSGLNYMMMETSLASPEFLYVRELHRNRELGRLQFLQGCYHMNLENHPRYWHGMPPMHYITHPLSPLLALTGAEVESVACIGSGRMRPALVRVSGNPYPVQTAIMQLRRCDVGLQITSVHYETAVQNRETFDVYGDRQSFVWARFWGDSHGLIRLHPAVRGGPKHSPVSVARLTLPSARHHLPASLRELGPPFEPSLLVHEFVSSICEGRAAQPDDIAAATYCAPGICAHESAMRAGALVRVPSFRTARR